MSTCRLPSGGVLLVVAECTAVLVAGLAWASSAQTTAPQTQPAATQPAGEPTMKLTVRSSAFDAGKPIPKKHTGEGPDVSPALAWSRAPAGTVEYALIMDDPDAPTPEPWVHWVIYKIPPAVSEFREGIPRSEKLTEPAGALQGQNTWPKKDGNIGYRGPMPPPGHGVHHYHFKVYALGKAVTLGPGATKRELLAAIKGQILAEGELIGTYQR
jgi:Raf kinase inhibitor-like YbhB/YbcL family protein